MLKYFHVVFGIKDDGESELPGFSISDSESYHSWKSIYQSLLKRGLEGVKPVISDAHKGESKAIKECFAGAARQGCQVHFMRNVFDRLPKKNTEIVRSELKSLFKTTNIEVARSMRDDLVNKYSDQYSSMIECLDEGFEEGFQYCAIEETNYSRLKSTNMLERLNSEIRRREKVVRIFPNVNSALRLIGTVLIDTHEEWTSRSRQYINFVVSLGLN